MDSRMKNGARNLGAATVNRVILMVLPFIARTVLVRILGSEYLGLSGLFTSILNVLNLSELGFGSALVYSMYKPIAENDTKKVCALLNLYRIIYKWIGIVITVAGCACAPFLSLLIKNGTPPDINIYVLYFIYLANVVVSYEFYAYKVALFTAYQRSDIKSNISTIFNIIIYVVQVGALILFKNYYIYIIWLPILTVIENVYTAKLSLKYYPEIKCYGEVAYEDKIAIKDHVKGLALQKICSASRNSFDSIIVSMFLGLNAIAMYNNYYFIMNSIHMFLYQIPNAVRASVGNSIAIETQKKNFDDFNKMNLIYVCITGICATCLVCLYQPFMKLWMGKDMTFPTVTMMLFCIYFVELCFSDIISLYKDGAGLWWKGRYRTVIEAIMNLILNFLLGWLYGVNGIILATIISMAIMTLGYGGYINFKYYFTDESFLKYVFVTLAQFFVICFAAALAYVICNVIRVNILLDLVIRLFVAVCVPLGVYWLIYRKTKYYSEAKKFICSILKTVIR